MVSSAGRTERGLTYVELLVSLVILAVLATAALPLARWTEKRRLEVRLRMTLQTMRDAIDTYKKYADEGLITQTDVDQMGYPLHLEDLVEGVEIGDPDSPQKKKIRLLARIPVDPITNEAEWGVRSYQDDWNATSTGGENVFDVYSRSDRVALDGTYYRDW
jgi:general secretion pathway protein G